MLMPLRAFLAVSVLAIVAAAEPVPQQSASPSPGTHLASANAPAFRGQPGEIAILPGGRRITPIGDEYQTGPGTFGLALSPDGSRVATADGGPNYFAVTLFKTGGDRWERHELRVKAKQKGADDDASWESVFMGLAFTSDSRLWASEGESGCVRELDVEAHTPLGRVCLDGQKWKDSYTGDLALDAKRHILYVVDQANFRIGVIDTKARRLITSIRVGRLPFAMALSPDAHRLYVTNVGVFEYRAVPHADAKNSRETGLPFPAFGFPSPDAEHGATRQTTAGKVRVPGLGSPNSKLSNSVAIVDVRFPSRPRIVDFVRTGLPFGGVISGGSSPAGVLVVRNRVYVSNAHNDLISVLDAQTGSHVTEIPLHIPGHDALRGIMPLGLAATPDGRMLVVAEAGINALALIDTATDRVVAHVPAGWFPTRVAVHGNDIIVVNAKGRGTGPNATRTAALPESFQADRRHGSLVRLPVPAPSQYAALTLRVFENNRFLSRRELWTDMPDIRHVVLIVKENRTFDEVFGDLSSIPDPGPELARLGRQVTPNHHSLADRYTISDNFYADSEVSVDGHHWLVGSYPDEWTESTMMASYGGAKNFRFPTSAPGRFLFAGGDSSVHAEELLESGTIWHHLARNKVPFRNYGEGFELTSNVEDPGEKPTGARFLTNMPMPEPLYQNTDRDYPGFNLNIPDQYRANQFINDMEKRFVSGDQPLPQFIYIHLPNDHMMDPRPADGYPTKLSYVADNDYALGRIVEYLSHTKWWPHMAVFVTEDDSQGGVDHVDSHRTVLMLVSPFAKPRYVSHINTSFPGLLRTVFELLHLTPLNLYDGSAPDLRDCFKSTADPAPFSVLREDPKIFVPEHAKDPLDPSPGPLMDDPRVLRRQHDER